MVVIEDKKYFFKVKHIWFSESPFDVADCDAVFFRACKNDVNIPGFKEKSSLTIVIDLQKDIDELWKSIGKTTRKHINRASRNKIKLQVNKNYEKFLDMFIKFTRKKKLKAYFFDVDTMKRMGALFTAELNGEVIAGILTVEDSENIRALIGGSMRFEADKKTSRLASYAYRFIVWKILEYSKDRGYKQFDFGGYYGGKDRDDPRTNIDFFKRQFGGEVVPYYNYEKYYSRIYALAKKLIKTRR